MLVEEMQQALLSTRGPVLLRPKHNYAFFEVDGERLDQVLHELQVKATVWASGIDKPSPCEMFVLALIRDSYIR